MQLDFGEDNQLKAEGDEIDQIINDFGSLVIEGEQNRNDSVVFIVDAYDLLPDQPEKLSKILELYSNFLKNKIIGNPRDKAGLIVYGINGANNNLKFQGISIVNSIHSPTAEIIKSIDRLQSQILTTFKRAPNPSKLHQVFWVYHNEIKQLDKRKHFFRLFLFTGNPNPHPAGSYDRQQAVSHAKKLSEVGTVIELFPFKVTEDSRFDIREFYANIISFDEEEINSGVLDMSLKIMNMEQRLKQKQHKKRSLNRLLLKVGNDTEIGVKVFSLVHKVKKPVGIKVDARNNNILKKVNKIIAESGEQLFDTDIGHFYPLGGEKIPLNRNDMKAIKSIESPGLTLIGFKPLTKLKTKYNYRESYFLYPDEEHVNGSSRFFHALIERMLEKKQLALAKFLPRVGSQLRFVALLPQKQGFNENHSQIPPGLNVIFLPYNDDLMNDDDPKTEYQGVEVSSELVNSTKLFINSFTIEDFDLRNFQNPALQRFYSTLQASALGEQEICLPLDTLKPQTKLLQNSEHNVNLINQMLELEFKKAKQEKIEQMSDRDSEQRLQEPKKRKKQNIKSESKTKDQDEEIQDTEACLRTGDFKGLTVIKLRNYLKSRSLKAVGSKEELIDRALSYLMG